MKAQNKKSFFHYLSLVLFFFFNTGIVFAWLSTENKMDPNSNQKESQNQALAQETNLISKMQQLTFVGPRAGEGYFSKDGKKMIFQAERQDQNPFYQIYQMDLKSGKTERISSGDGKTTCAYFHPSSDRVMYSSTHLDPKWSEKAKQEYEQRKQKVQQKYSWSYDENFDIFEKNLRTGKITNLTKTLGYDAEGDYSPDGKWIVFASNRSGYTDNLTAEQKKLFQQDPSYMMDIYKMKSDGTQVQRLTTVAGYDGGPFFSSDGKKITWRHFSEDGQKAEIWVMNADGREQTQITRSGVMSWSPFFHPSGKYIIYTSNLLGFQNFELFIVDVDGKHEPVRVTFLDGFDGLPVFTPDGKKLSWTRRNEKGDSQIYWADWDHEKALELLEIPTNLPGTFKAGLDPENFQKWVKYLAGPQFAGRKTGSQEEKTLHQSLKKQLETWGYQVQMQSFSFTSGVSLGSQNTFTLNDKSLEIQKDFLPASVSSNVDGKTLDGQIQDLTFVGYGLEVPATTDSAAFSSYKDIDVQGKWIMMFRDLPEQISASQKAAWSMAAGLMHKLSVAKMKGAKGVLLVQGPNSIRVPKKLSLQVEGQFEESFLPVLQISDQVASELFEKSKLAPLKDYQDQADRGMAVTAQLKVTGHVRVDLKKETTESENLIASQIPGFHQGIASFQGQEVMIGAHADHLGRGDLGNSLARSFEAGKIHFGADDNASGVAVVMELARKISKTPMAKKVSFALWSGEEIGLLGSKSYLKTREKNPPKAYINLDMVGRLRDKLQIQGVGSSTVWKSFIEELRPSIPTTLVLQEDPYQPTDSMAFYLSKVPGVSFFTGAHSEYHSPRDMPSTISTVGLVQVAKFVESFAQKTITASNIPFVQIEGSRKNLEGRKFRLYLGTIPDYSQEGVKGVRLQGVQKNSPAEQAGLQEKDVIIELNTVKVENLHDYVTAMQGMTAKKASALKILRSGQLVELQITPELKE